MANVAKRKWVYNGVEKEAWVVRYFDRSGSHRSRQFDKKKDADRYRTQVEVEIEQGTHIPKSEAKTVRDICEEFIRVQEMRLKDGRIGRGYMKVMRGTIDNSILPRLGSRVLKDLQPADYDQFYADMCKLDGLAPVTARDRLGMMKQISKFALRRKYLAVDNVSVALEDLRGAGATHVRTFTVDQLRYLLKACSIRRSHVKLRTFALQQATVHLAAFCGLRFGEIMGLTLHTVDLERRVLRIRHSLTEFDELKSPKTQAGVRDVPIPEHLVEYLQEWISSYFVINDRALIFRSINDQRVFNSNFHNDIWHPLLSQAGLLDEQDPFHFHALRHFAASWWIQQGKGVMEVASLLGHRTFNTTLQTYAHSIAGGHGRAEEMQTMASRLLDGPVFDASAIKSITQELRN